MVSAIRRCFKSASSAKHVNNMICQRSGVELPTLYPFQSEGTFSTIYHDCILTAIRNTGSARIEVEDHDLIFETYGDKKNPGSSSRMEKLKSSEGGAVVCINDACGVCCALGDFDYVDNLSNNHNFLPENFPFDTSKHRS